MAVLDTIKNIGDLVPKITDMRERCRNTCSEIEVILVDMRNRANDNAKVQEQIEKQKQNQEKYEGLRLQRESEKREAEKKIDAQIFGKNTNEKNQTSTIEKKEESAPKENKPFVSKMSGKFGRPGEPDTSFKPRPAAGNFSRPQYPNSSRPQSAGARPPFQSRFGQRPPFNSNGPRRTWTPGQATPGGYGAKQPYTPRPQQNGTGYQRPMGVLPKPTEKFVPGKVNTFSPNKKRGKGNFAGQERNAMDKRTLLRRGIIEEQEIEERMLTRIFKTKKSKENSSKVKVEKSNVVVIDDSNLTIKTLSEKIGKPVNQIIKQLMVLGQMCTINSIVDFDTAELVSDEFGIKLERGHKATSEEKMSAIHSANISDEEMKPRCPVVTIMGHVDHGKTTLLDKFRNSNVVSGESGGITQHIGAYQVDVSGGRKVTFMDTPGHAAFDKMRARGAKITDIAILIVAGDDGVMPQTVEAIEHIQKQSLPMIVAVNKCDKKEFDLQKVYGQLAEYNIVPEEWGGNTIVVPISAFTGQGLDKLLEMILLVADMNNYRVNYDKAASGAIIEAKLDVTRGPVVTVLVQSGTLRVGDTLLAGTTSGKVRAMKDDHGHAVKTAIPGMPVRIIGFANVPMAGDDVYVVDDKLVKQVVAERKSKEKINKAGAGLMTEGFDPFTAMKKTDKKQLNLILKTDVSGSLEAIEQSINNITSEEVSVNIISRGVGVITDNDIDLASVTNALVLAFNTKTSALVLKSADKLKVKVHNFDVIYKLFDFVTEEMVKLFTPKFEIEHYGKVEVRALFKSSSFGQIAGCMVMDGKVARSNMVILMRGKKELGKFKIDSLKIKTDDQKEVLKGAECGIKLHNAPELMVGDILDVIGEKQLPIIFGGKEYKF